MEPKEVKEEGCKERIQHSLKKRKQNLEGILWSKRIVNPASNQNLLDLDEEKEEPLKPVKGFLPLNQYKKSHYNRRKRKGKRCWNCQAYGHLKFNCPKIKCFFCGCQGHTKKKCYKYEIHYLIHMLKKGQNVAESTEKQKKAPKKVKTAYDRMREVTFRHENEKVILVHKNQDLAVYSNDNIPFEKARRGFEPPRLPKWKLDKAIYGDIQTSRLKFSDLLPHQCGSDGEVFDGHQFLIHCIEKHRGFVPAGSLINASPYRFWLLWFDDYNFLEFMQAKGDPKYIKADPPWI